ncbi:hypothetical protein SAMN05421736_12917 [Evansella caseinilytica]|uniref:C-type cytochrome biogenesis protein CcmI n=1 Tax=Evansella caseinilytica TaxID=1503961 RepID=A0A1H3UYW3_9BACI|nr:hypothetical protein [Evansella caseinilytica]SDZ67161.1 hypothetical protein SAMN05421736_12917 [Evansella caseinilytica]
MAYVASILIIGLCVYLVAQPFFSQKRAWNPEKMKDDLDELSKEHLFATINELEMEFNMGKLPEEDYRKLKGHYEKLAAEKLKEESVLLTDSADSRPQVADGAEMTMDEEIELEIAEELQKMKQKRKGR